MYLFNFFKSNPVNTDNFISKFNDTIGKLKAPNCGGCLFIAYTFYLGLIKYQLDTSSFGIKQYGFLNEAGLIHNNIRFLNGENHLTPWADAHFTWLYNNQEYDAGQRYLNLNLNYFKVVVLPFNRVNNIDDFCVKALTLSSWNPEFNRNKAIEIIKRDLNINLSHLKQ